MPDDVFRIVIAVAVGLACLGVVVQATVVIAFYRTIRSIQTKVESYETVVQRIGPVLDRIGPVLEKAGPAIDKIGPTLDRVGPALEKVGPVADHLSSVLANTSRIMEDLRPRLKEISADVAGITHTTREKVEHIGELLDDAGEKVTTRLGQIDEAVHHTVEQVEHAGDNVKRAVMRPVREVNGVAAGISAAVSTLVKRRRKSSVDAATQDEEMFI